MIKHIVQCRAACTMLMLVMAFTSAIAQRIPDLSTYRDYPVNKIPEAKISELKANLNSRNISYGQFVVLATNNGLSQQKANAIVSRMQEDASERSNTTTPTTAAPEQAPSISAPMVAKAASGGTSEIFGKDLFEKDNVSFQPNVNMPTPANYVLGPGDEVVIDVWGAAKKHYQLMVSKEGFIQLENIGPIYVTGLSLERARSRVTSRLSELYRGLSGAEPNTFAQVYIGKIRTIKVTVMGNAEVPGTYTLPSISTVFHGLYASGGPNEQGSFRKVQLIRYNRKVAELDLYQYLMTGTAKGNQFLRDGDIILIPSYDRRVRISGEVLKEGLFELKEGESAEALLEFSGGYTAWAYTKLIQLERNTPRDRLVKDIDGKELHKLPLKNGDQIHVRRIINRFENRVKLVGALQMPGSYEIGKNTTLLQVIQKAEGLHQNAFLGRALLMRYTESYTREAQSINLQELLEGKDTLVLQADDVVHVYFIDELQEAQKVQIEGAVQSGGEYTFYTGMTLQDLIAQAGGLTDAAASNNIEVARRIRSLEATEETAEIFSFQIDAQLAGGNDFALEPYDYVIVRRAPGYQSQHTVLIEGEVTYPGTYVIQSKSEKLSALIQRAGGVTTLADLNGARLLRSAESGTEAVGIDLHELLSGADAVDIIIKPGDRIIIPSTEQTITIEGAVLNPIALHYQPGKRLKHYVNSSGGYALRAQKRKIYVVNANNTSSRVRNYVLFKKYPKVEAGATIHIPYKPERDKIETRDVVSISTGVATLSLVVISVINALNNGI